MWLRMIALELRRQGGEAAARALVAGVGLELDPHAAERLERVLEHQQFRLDVCAAAPGARGQPRPADLDDPVRRPHVEVAAAADQGAPLRRRRDRERPLGAGSGGVRATPHPAVELLAARAEVVSQGQISSGCAASQRPSACSRASGSSTTIEPSRRVVSGARNACHGPSSRPGRARAGRRGALVRSRRSSRARRPGGSRSIRRGGAPRPGPGRLQSAIAGQPARAGAPLAVGDQGAPIPRPRRRRRPPAARVLPRRPLATTRPGASGAAEPTTPAIPPAVEDEDLAVPRPTVRKSASE